MVSVCSEMVRVCFEMVSVWLEIVIVYFAMVIVWCDRVSARADLAMLWFENMNICSDMAMLWYAGRMYLIIHPTEKEFRLIPAIRVIRVVFSFIRIYPWSIFSRARSRPLFIS